MVQVSDDPVQYWCGSFFYDDGGPRDVNETDDIQDATELPTSCRHIGRNIAPWRTKDNYPGAKFIKVECNATYELSEL